MRIGVRAAILVLFWGAGCKTEVSETAGEMAPPSGPEEKGSFLNEPAGVPPSPLVPQHVGVTIRTARDVSVVREAIEQRLGPDAVVGTRSGDDVTVFLTKYAAWYLPVDRLERLAKTPSAALPVPEIPSPTGIPILRAWVPKPRLTREAVAAIYASGGRGLVTFWFPLAVIRERLQDGAAGLWRGITRVRDQIPGAGPKFGGTPVFAWAAMPQSDYALLGADLPRPFVRALSLEVFRPIPESARDGIVELLADVPPRPRVTDLPNDWRALLSGPDGVPMTWLQPKNASVPDRSFSDAIEALVPVVRQGGEVWIVIGLPIAQEHIPARH